jgi:hypothetical protein
MDENLMEQIDRIKKFTYDNDTITSSGQMMPELGEFWSCPSFSHRRPGYPKRRGSGRRQLGVLPPMSRRHRSR